MLKTCNLFVGSGAARVLVDSDVLPRAEHLFRRTIKHKPDDVLRFLFQRGQQTY